MKTEKFNGVTLTVTEEAQKRIEKTEVLFWNILWKF